MKTKNKKNFTILGIGVLNLILSIFAISKLSNNIPINIFEDNVIDKMCSKQLLLIIPIIVLVISIIQVIYRLKTMDKVVTNGKRIEDAVFTFIDGILIYVNWILVYIGYSFTSTNLIKVEIPIWYVIMAFMGIVIVAIYSTFPINKFGSRIGLRIKETLENEEVWRTANKLNAFTGLLSGIAVVLLSGYFMLYGFNWIYLLIIVILLGLLLFYIPILYAKMIYQKISNRVVE